MTIRAKDPALRVETRFQGAESVAKSLRDRWQELCSRFLPVEAENPVWRYNRLLTDDDPNQGWKLHVSANVLTACDILQVVAPFLNCRGLAFKAPRSLEELMRINSGLYYGYSQVGKFITIYPRTDREAKLIARRLHQLTPELRAPMIPFDLRFKPGSCIYYRNGAFKAIEIRDPDGRRIPAIHHPSGDLVPDPRQEAAKPVWVPNLMNDRASRQRQATGSNPLQTRFRVFRAIS